MALFTLGLSLPSEDNGSPVRDTFAREHTQHQHLRQIDTVGSQSIDHVSKEDLSGGTTKKDALVVSHDNGLFGLAPVAKMQIQLFAHAHNDRLIEDEGVARRFAQVTQHHLGKVVTGAVRQRVRQFPRLHGEFLGNVAIGEHLREQFLHVLRGIVTETEFGRGHGPVDFSTRDFLVLRQRSFLAGVHLKEGRGGDQLTGLDDIFQTLEMLRTL